MAWEHKRSGGPLVPEWASFFMGGKDRKEGLVSVCGRFLTVAALFGLLGRFLTVAALVGAS